MRKSHLRLYAPFLGLVLVQALFVAMAPSTPGPTGADVVLDSGGAAGGGAGSVGSGTAAGGTAGGFATTTPGAEGSEPGSAGTATSRTTGTTAGQGGAQGSGTGTGQGSGTGTAGGNPTVVGGNTAGGGDTSHCTPDGRQFAVLYNSPPCAPKWSGGDNGGATHPGVTAEEVTVFFYRERKNPAVEAILVPEGLARSRQQEIDFITASEEFINKHYEFYGRKVKLVLFEGQCPETPPDIPVCKAEAREIARQKPFMVLWPVPLYPDVFDEFFKLGIITVGGWHFDERFFTERRPYRYDVFMDGTQSADNIAEYYCKKLANKNATNTGRVIHDSIGLRGQVARRLGIIVPENTAFLENAKRVQQKVAACDAQDPIVVTYLSDIERAQSQSSANISALIDAKVTTVVCICDPIAPVFRTGTATQQNYFPEHLMAGSGLLDFDKVGRLYESQQWVHAFGPSHLGQPLAHSESDAGKVWTDVGRSGEPCGACLLPWVYYQFAANAIQVAGPNLNPLTLQEALHNYGTRGGWEATGGRADLVMTRFGPGDYTSVSDAREVYWSPSALSRIDNRPGSYVALNGGRRYVLGEWPSAFDIPVAPQ